MSLIRMVTAVDCAGHFTQLESRSGTIYNFSLDVGGEGFQKLSPLALQVSFMIKVLVKKLKWICFQILIA